MIRTLRLLTAVAAVAALPAGAADTGAQAKDRAHENAIHERMKAREETPHQGLGSKIKATADQAADAVRAGGARSARSYHGAAHGGKKLVHRGAKKTSDATK